MAAVADEPLPHRWLYPSAVPQGPDDALAVLTDAQVDEYHRTGCCVLDGLWPAALVARVKADAERIFRGGGEQTAAHSGLNSNLMSFPSNESDALNELTLHPRLLTAMSELLRLPPTELRLAQSELWEKSAANNNHGNSDQRTHMGKLLPQRLLPQPHEAAVRRRLYQPHATRAAAPAGARVGGHDRLLG